MIVQDDYFWDCDYDYHSIRNKKVFYYGDVWTSLIFVFFIYELFLFVVNLFCSLHWLV